MDVAADTKTGKVVGLGMATLDCLIRVRDLDAPMASVAVQEQVLQGGGLVATALTAVARLGGQAEIWCTVGCDDVGALIVAGLAREGVDVSQAARVEASGLLYLVFVDGETGERRICGGRRVPPPPHGLARPERLEGAGCLLLDGHYLPDARRASAAARNRGIPVVGDYCRVNGEIPDFLRLTDHAVCAETVLPDLNADDPAAACRRLLSMGPSRAVVTCGAKGVIGFEGDNVYAYPAFPVDVVDTTGAGDTFHGAYCFGLTCGLPFDANLVFASAVAALQCRQLGGRAGIPTRAETLAFLAAHDRPPWCDAIRTIQAHFA